MSKEIFEQPITAKKCVNEYIDSFLKAWSVSLPIEIIAALLVGPPIKKFVDKITK